jgi:membrane protein YdbS with pleckstrin-like domain
VTTPPAETAPPAETTPPVETTPPASGLTAPPLGADQPLAGDLPLERHRLQPKVTRYWRWRMLFSGLPVLLLFASLAYVIPWGAWWLRWGIVAILAAILVLGMIVLPPIRYRVFWYAISSTEIDIQHGIIFIKRSVVPMHRVQNLRTERGPMADHYQMTNLKIRTAAGSVGISGLGRIEADDLCDRISQLSDIADDV